ncbi:hypothetical protein NDU88_011069 [Pleurodeles waltl]|uniref:Uncharacterized protein n=1 Tax=Pleurodeles waltl TaxID=8319 RepID=A0AAV7PXE9_PLEWA|nr:hypothetical protein NDU88_011069 [Pleurodeles waltl]
MRPAALLPPGLDRRLTPQSRGRATLQPALLSNSPSREGAATVCSSSRPPPHRSDPAGCTRHRQRIAGRAAPPARDPGGVPHSRGHPLRGPGLCPSRPRTPSQPVKANDRGPRAPAPGRCQASTSPVRRGASSPQAQGLRRPRDGPDVSHHVLLRPEPRPKAHRSRASASPRRPRPQYQPRSRLLFKRP